MWNFETYLPLLYGFPPSWLVSWCNHCNAEQHENCVQIINHIVICLQPYSQKMATATWNIRPTQLIYWVFCINLSWFTAADSGSLFKLNELWFVYCSWLDFWPLQDFHGVWIWAKSSSCPALCFACWCCYCAGLAPVTVHHCQVAQASSTALAQQLCCLRGPPGSEQDRAYHAPGLLRPHASHQPNLTIIGLGVAATSHCCNSRQAAVTSLNTGHLLGSSLLDHQTSCEGGREVGREEGREGTWQEGRKGESAECCCSALGTALTLLRHPYIRTFISYASCRLVVCSRPVDAPFLVMKLMDLWCQLCSQAGWVWLTGLQPELHQLGLW